MTSIFIGNLPFQATEREVRSAFEQYGRVSSVHMLTDRATGQSKGCAFVGMSRLDDADEAIRRLNGASIGGRRVTVNEAHSNGHERRPVGSSAGGSSGSISPRSGPTIPWDLF
jgi:RNA recognition motif-containing protein